ncbi:MAG TPA: HDIG domain-containing protein [Amycolatopsis sp.]|nr:HDIG domain-containing protein [Amycolatopsis sp.]
MTVATSWTALQQAHVDEQIALLEARLGNEHNHLPLSAVHECVQQARARFEHARVLTFLPILIERAARAALGRPPLPEWGRALAERLLADELPRRWRHSQGVAARAAEIAKVLPPEDGPVLIGAAWLHDIGYAHAAVDSGLHQLDGARYLAHHHMPHRVCALIAHHAGAAAVAAEMGLSGELAEFTDERGPTRDALWYCDMTTSPDGEPVGFDDRMAELRTRRAAADPVIRALAVNGPERAAAVRRTEELLASAEPSVDVVGGAGVNG